MTDRSFANLENLLSLIHGSNGMYGDNFTVFGQCILQWVEMYPWNSQGDVETVYKLIQSLFKERNVRQELNEKLGSVREKLEARLLEQRPPDYSSEVIRIHKGRLIIDATSKVPNIKEAREATERYVFGTALKMSGGNISAASRLTGLTKNEGHYLNKLLLGHPGRRPRAKKAESTKTKPPRKRPRSKRK